MKMKLSLNNGFTMLELVVVLAMVGILSVVAVPSFTQQIKQNRLTSTANQLHSIFKFARSEAAKREEAIDLDAKDGEWIVKLGSEILNVFKPSHSSVSIKDGLDDVVVSATGGTSNNSFLVTDEDSSTHDYCLHIYVSGQSKLIKEDACS